jgi:DNA helicase-2/ATP-dependent DNA helicase PcrA
VEETTLRGYLKKLQPVNKSLFESDDPKQKAGKFIEELIAAVHTKTLQQWFEFLINESGILHWVMKQDDRTWQMNKLSCLFDFIKETTHRQPHLTLKELVNQFDLLEENNLPLPLVQTTGSEDGVNIMTCHSSKGLEFEHVFFVNLRMDIWEKKKSGNQNFAFRTI